MAAWFPQRNDPDEVRRLVALLLGSVYCVGFGLLDDRFNFRAGPQYLIQFGASLIGFGGLIFVKHVNNPFGEGFLFGEDGFPWWLVFVITVFWFMGMMNTINLLDGASGLVAGVTAILAGVLAMHMIFKANPPQFSVALLPLALMGAALGFLPFNFARRIFMGSSGSYFLGFVIAALGIIGGARLAAVMMVVGLPALEVAWLMFSRWRRGVSPGEGGRDHLHFRLQDMGLSEHRLVVGYWLFCAAFGALTLTVDSRFYKLVALGALGWWRLAFLSGRAGGRWRTETSQQCLSYFVLRVSSLHATRNTQRPPLPLQCRRGRRRPGPWLLRQWSQAPSNAPFSALRGAPLSRRDAI